MPNIIKKIAIESAYTASHRAIQLLIDNRDERTIAWESEINEHIRSVERSEAISRMDGRQACSKDDPGNSPTFIYSTSDS